jgi:adenine-specific DNA glycosylase
LGRAEEFPRARKPPPTRRIEEVAVAAERRGAVLVLQRGEGGPFAGMWELPRLDSRERPIEEITPERVLLELTRLRCGGYTAVGETQSTFTHHRITTRLHRARVEPGSMVRRSRHVAARWVKPQDLHLLAASKAQKRIFQLLL